MTQKIEEKYERLKRIRDEVLACKKCSLYKTRHFPMIGKWSHNAKIMFIGEAPGKQEDMTWHPFRGKADDIFDEMLQSVGLTREEIYITNILKCRPPNNRDPLPDELAACSGYLQRQIAIINPQIICTLWRFAMQYVFSLLGLQDQIEPLSVCQWKIYRVWDKKILPLFHPAAALYDSEKKVQIIKGISILI